MSITVTHTRFTSKPYFSNDTEFCGTIDADAKRIARAPNFGWANHQSRVE